MALQGFLFGCALLVIAGGGVLVKYITRDPCEGSGNFRDPVYYDDDEDDNESAETEELTSEVANLSKKIDTFNRRR